LRRAVRAAWHVLRLSLAVIAGAVIRFARRLLRKPPRLWYGLSNMVWESNMVQAGRAAGFPTLFVLRDTPQARYLATLIDDVVILGEERGIRADEVHWAALRSLFLHGDVNMAYFDVTYFGPSLGWANESVLRLMRLAGIRIIVMAHGGDVTYRDRYISRYDWVDRVQKNNPAWDLVDTRPGTLERIRWYCENADLVLPGDSVLARLIPRNDVMFKYFPMDTRAMRNAGVSDRAVPVVVHAPTSRWIKGSDDVFAALEHLRAKGIEYELRLVEKVSRAEALRIYESADVLVDQLCMGAYGTLSLESMALGKPTLVYLDQEHLGDPVFNMPCVNTNRDNIVRVLAVVLQVPELRRRLAAASRASVERYQSIETLAEVWRQLIDFVWRGTPLRLEQTRHFEPSRTPRSFTEDPAREEFWPVPVADLMHDIEAALERVR
jgi:glycosyltransferase involved in cell wall biosynthesis